MTNSTSKTSDSPYETTESFKKAAQTVTQELGLTFLQEEPAANSAEKHNQLKSVMREEMLAQGISPGAIAEAEKFADLRREFVQEAMKLKSESVSQPVIPTISSEDAEKYHKNSEEAIAEMLLIRNKAQQPGNNNISTKKPD